MGIDTSTQLDFADFFPLASDAGPIDGRFRDDVHGLFDGSGSASKGAERHLTGEPTTSERWFVDAGGHIDETESA